MLMYVYSVKVQRFKLLWQRPLFQFEAVSINLQSNDINIENKQLPLLI